MGRRSSSSGRRLDWADPAGPPREVFDFRLAGVTSARNAVLLIAALLLALAGCLVAIRELGRARTFQLFGSLVARVRTDAPRVALTFDDGPVASRLDTLLEVLGSRDVRATFFVTGRELAAAPDAGRRLVDAGHELGNHTYSHRRMAFVSPATVRAELEPTDSLIRLAGHQGDILFRPPYSYKLIALPWYLARNGRTTVTWDVEPDSYPEVAATAETIVAHVLSRARPGSIILLHPWYPSRATSLASVGMLIDSLHARGLEVVPVRELLR